MFFVMFVFFGGIVWILGLAFVMPARHRVSNYSALSLLFVLTGLILFTFFSWWAGIIPMTFGDGAFIRYSVSFPEWYLRRGALGLAIVLLGILGIASPAIAAWIVRRQPTRRAPISTSQQRSFSGEGATNTSGRAMLALMRENQNQRRWIMKTRIVLLCSLGLVLLTAGCTVPIYAANGSGNVVTESRSVSDLNAATLAGFGDLTIIQGDSESLTIEAEDNILPHITTQVTNGRLVIGYDNQDWANYIRPTKPIRFNLSLKNLNSLELSGAGNVQSASIKTDQLDVHVSGAGNLKLDKLEANSLVATLSGAGNMDITGNATNQDLRVTGLGSLGAGNLKGRSAKITVSGAGDATVAAQDNLDVIISGAGSVRYYGNPKVTQRISGIGSVRNLGNE